MLASRACLRASIAKHYLAGATSRCSHTLLMRSLPRKPHRPEQTYNRIPIVTSSLLSSALAIIPSSSVLPSLPHISAVRRLLSTCSTNGLQSVESQTSSPSAGPHSPDDAQHRSHLLAYRFEHHRSLDHCHQHHDQPEPLVESVSNAEAFWGQQCTRIEWFREPCKTLNRERAPLYRWFEDGITNICHNALDRHVNAGHQDQVALHYHCAYDSTSSKSLTYGELLSEVSAMAEGLRAQGVSAGDRVLIYMPMIVEGVIAMLACARVGAVHSVVFGGFAAPELASRICDARPKAVLTSSCGLEPGRVLPYLPIVHEALRIAVESGVSRPFTVVRQRSQHPAELDEKRAEFDWTQFCAPYDGKESPCEQLASTDPLYVLYTSGTTGTPKGIVRDHGGYATALSYSMDVLYDVKPGEVFWAASDIGWVVGHSYITYAPLLHRCTAVLYEGKPIGTPDHKEWWRVVNKYGVHSLFTAPTALRAIRGVDPTGNGLLSHDTSSLRSIWLAGERTDPATLQWSREKFSNIPVIDHYWQSETGWPAVSICRHFGDLDIPMGAAGLPVPGFDVQILDPKTAEPLPANRMGEIAFKLPLPPGCLPTLWRSDEQYIRKYLQRFPGYYVTGDAGYQDQDGFVFVMSRTDDVINCAGHRLSTGQMEEVVSSHPDVVECAVIGIPDELKGELPLAFVVVRNARTGDQIAKELVKVVRDTIGAVAVFKRVVLVERLPKTRSGKILRAQLRQICTPGQEVIIPSTIENAAALEEVAAAWKRQAS